MLSSKKIMAICWVLFIFVLIGSLCLEFLIKHPHVTFGIEGILFFNAAYGFVSCVAIVLISKICGFVLKRRENYYDTDA